MRSLTREELSAVAGGSVGNTGNPVVYALAIAAGGTNRGLNIASTPVTPRSAAN